MQRDHWEEKIDHGRRLAQRSGRAEQEIQAFYGESEKQLKTQIKTLHSKLEKSGFRGWWFKARHGKTARLDLANSEKTLDNIQWRMRERRQISQNHESIANDRLSMKQYSEKERMEKHLQMKATYPEIKEAFEKRESREPIPSKEMDQSLSPGRSR